MKNELGIEVKCENCLDSQMFCRDNEVECSSFIARSEAYKQRIKELQEQQFTWDELNTIKSIIIEVKRVRHPRYCGFHPTQLLSKIERILNEQ